MPEEERMLRLTISREEDCCVSGWYICPMCFKKFQGMKKMEDHWNRKHQKCEFHPCERPRKYDVRKEWL